MSYYLDALTEGDCEVARQWRNRDEVRLGLRTPYVLTDEMQREFYRTVVSARHSQHRFWAVRHANDSALVAMVGLTGISWENGHAEISLVVTPTMQGQGIGSSAVELALAEAFGRMRLLTVTGEVYLNNPAVGFWQKQFRRWHGLATLLPRRKFWDGTLHDALHFWFTAEGWNEARRVQAPALEAVS